MIKENIKIVNDRIKNACKKSGINFSDITLVAVSKTFPVKENLYAYESFDPHTYSRYSILALT